MFKYIYFMMHDLFGDIMNQAESASKIAGNKKCGEHNIPVKREKCACIENQDVSSFCETIFRNVYTYSASIHLF